MHSTNPNPWPPGFNFGLLLFFLACLVLAAFIAFQ